MAVLDPSQQTVNTGGDWWQANAPSARTSAASTSAGSPISNLQVANPATNTGVTGGMAPGQTPQGDPNALIAQWKQTHPASNPDLPGLVQFLNSHGLQATQATHAGGQLSDDKIILNGGMWDLGSSFGAPGGSWFDSPAVDYNDPNAGGSGGGGSNTNLSPQNLSTGWTQAFNAPSAEDAMNSPGIQAALKMGEQAIQRSAASKGTLLTGGTLKDLTSFANDLGSQAYGDVWGRAMSERQNAQSTFFGNQDRLFGRNLSLAQLGSGAANTGSDLNTQAGNAAAAGQVGSANANLGALSGIANAAGTTYSGIQARNQSSYDPTQAFTQSPTALTGGNYYGKPPSANAY